MNDFLIDKIRNEYPASVDRMKGYSESEIGKIERLYGIDIKDDFFSFLRHAGRCDGGLIGDDPFIIYRPSWSVRAHVLFQVSFFNSLQEIGAWDYLNKPFVFSLERETQYYFLQTGLHGTNWVYHFDENSNAVRKLELTFADYVLATIGKYPHGGVICVGDLLNI